MGRRIATALLRPSVLAAVALVLLYEAVPSSGARRGFAVPLYRKNGATRGRSLLRNSTYPLHGTIKDLGYFYATVFLGTPAQQFAVIVDTGSTMTYVPCSTCGVKCGNHRGDSFDPFHSVTYQAIGCKDDMCSCGNPTCSCQQDQCFYSRHYAEQSSSQGVLLQDVFHLQDGSGAVPMVFGCETAETGEIFKQEADGIMGLGNSEVSVINQLTRGGHIDNMFSLCFGSVEGDGVLMLGDVALPEELHLQYTPLLATSAHYYLVHMEAMVLGQQVLDIKQNVFSKGYGVVLDSGTTFTYLPTEAYVAFRSALETAAQAAGLARTPGPDPRFADSDVCMGGAPPLEQAERLAEVFPTLELRMGGGVSLKLHPLNYLFVHTKEAGAYCLGVFDNGHQGTLLGGITFRNVLIQYDLANQRVGFGYTACQRLGQELAPPCDVMSELLGEGGKSLPFATDCRQSLHSEQRAPEAPPPAAWPPGPPAGAEDGAADRPGDEDTFLRSEEEDPPPPPGRSSLWTSILAAAAFLTVGLLALAAVRAYGAAWQRVKPYSQLRDASPDGSLDGDGDARALELLEVEAVEEGAGGSSRRGWDGGSGVPGGGNGDGDGSGGGGATSGAAAVAVGARSARGGAVGSDVADGEVLLISMDSN